MDGTRTFKIRSALKPKLKRKTLIRGSLIAGSGGVLLVFGGALFPLDVLRIWGIPTFIVSLVLISLGLIPYRRLMRLEVTPHELHFDGDYLTFYPLGKLCLKVPSKSIESVFYAEKGDLYGICLKLKRPLPDQVKILDPGFNSAGFMADSMQRFEGCDLFFPYFSSRSADELKSQLE